MPGFISRLFSPLTDAPTRAGKKISDAMEPYEPIQQDGQGGLRDWIGWTDASAKGLLQGSAEAAGKVLSDMTSPFSLGMQAIGGSGLKRIGDAARLAKNASRLGKFGNASNEVASVVGRLGPEFAAVGEEAADNAPRIARASQEATNMANASKAGNVGKTSGIGASRPEELAASSVSRKPLPQVEDAYVRNPNDFNMTPAGTSIYKPEVSKEMGRLMVDMMDDGTAKDAFKIAQDKYPRLMGHMSEINIGPSPKYGAWNNFMTAGTSAKAGEGLPGLTSMSKMRINPNSIMSNSAEGMANTIGHELAHGAQRLRKGNSGFREAYDAGMSGDGGLKGEYEYMTNPLERSARKSGKKFAKYATRDE